MNDDGQELVGTARLGSPLHVAPDQLPDELRQLWGNGVILDLNDTGEAIRLGHGATAVVYLGTYQGSRVAIKLFARDELTRPYFRREMRAWGEMVKLQAHPNLVQLREARMLEDHHAYVVMDFVQGSRLDEIAPSLGVIDRLKAVRGMVRGTMHLHEHGLIHRDLKPQNTIVFGTNAVVVDVGLVKRVEPGPTYQRAGGVITAGDRATDQAGSHGKCTTAGVIQGTPLFMAPEQARAEVLSFSADIYALGMSICTLLEQPVLENWGGTDRMTHRAMGRLDFPLQPFATACGGELMDALIGRMLSMDAHERPTAATCNDCLNEIVTLLEAT